jgi:NAD(P)-dependent dehydrogenase (short-subunit alcohol dehydrogenase family)
MPDEQRLRYLTELDDSLPMPLERRAEVIEEINAHLDDAVTARLERGDSLAAAEAHAQARLGSAQNLAADLARPEQSAWRLFAAVGASLRTGVGQWIYGFLLGWLVLLLGVYLLSAVVWTAGEWLGTTWRFEFTDQGWNTTLTAGAIALGLYFAGRAMPRTMSTVSRRPFTQVRQWVAAFGTMSAFGVLVFAADMPHNWASAIGATLAPIGFAVGAYRPGLLPGRVRWPYHVIVGAFLLVAALSAMFALSNQPGGASEHVTAGEPGDRGLAVVGPWRNDPMTSDEPLLWSIYLGDQTGEGERYEWELNGNAAMAGLRGLRVEAWHSNASPHGELDQRYDEPFAVAPIERTGRMLTASLDTASTPGVSSWELIVTGVGRDGTRYIVDAGTILSSTFTGSVWDWIVAVSAD